MGKSIDIKKSLVDVNDSVIVVIDIQDRFLVKYGTSVSKPMVEKVTWLLSFAQLMNVPVVAMAEDIENTGTLTQPVLDALLEGVKVHNKNVFGLAGHPEILADIEATGRKTAILVGMETDVCVAHSALGLMENNYQVVVLKDCVATTAGADEIGLSRMRDAGAVISSAKAIYYEWLRSVKNTDAAYAKAPDLEEEVPSSLEL